MLDRERSGREANPTAAVSDSQSVKTSESGGPRSYDAGKKIKGRKRHAMVEPKATPEGRYTDGRGLTLNTHPASIQDRDGAPPVMRMSRCRWPFVQLAFMTAATSGIASLLPPPSVSRSCASPKGRSGSLSTRDAGSSNASSRGSAATGASPKILRPPSPPPTHSSTPPRPSSRCAASHVPHKVRDRLSGATGDGQRPLARSGPSTSVTPAMVICTPTASSRKAESRVSVRLPERPSLPAMRPA